MPEVWPERTQDARADHVKAPQQQGHTTHEVEYHEGTHWMALRCYSASVDSLNHIKHDTVPIARRSCRSMGPFLGDATVEWSPKRPTHAAINATSVMRRACAETPPPYSPIPKSYSGMPKITLLWTWAGPHHESKTALIPNAGMARARGKQGT